MKRTRIMGPCLVAVCALFAFIATSAFATENLPHYGKCEKEEGGKYTNAGCTKEAKPGKAGKFTWVPLKSDVGFTSKKTGGNAVLEGASGVEISCEGQVEKKGEYGPTDNEVKNIVGEFSKCKALGGECESEGAGKEQINTEKLDGEPGIVEKVGNEEKNVDGNDLRGEAAPNGSAKLAKFSCAGAPIVVTGGVVVKAEEKGKLITNKMLNAVTVEFVAKKPGKQVPEKWTPNFEGPSNTGARHEIVEHLESSVAGGSPEPSGQTLTTKQTTVGKVKVELRQCANNIVCP
jgi:hypothetical protein